MTLIDSINKNPIHTHTPILILRFKSDNEFSRNLSVNLFVFHLDYFSSYVDSPI